MLRQEEKRRNEVLQQVEDKMIFDEVMGIEYLIGYKSFPKKKANLYTWLSPDSHWNLSWHHKFHNLQWATPNIDITKIHNLTQLRAIFIGIPSYFDKLLY